MAARTITTKLALEGEAEYRAQLQRINAELRLHKSELEKVQAEYAGQLNSLEALGRESEFGEIAEARHGADGFFRSEHIALRMETQPQKRQIWQGRPILNQEPCPQCGQK